MFCHFHACGAGAGGFLQSTDVSTCALRFLHLEALEERHREELQYLCADVANVLEYCRVSRQRIQELLHQTCVTDAGTPQPPAWLTQVLLDTKQDWAAVREGIRIRLIDHDKMLQTIVNDMAEIFPNGVVDPAARRGGATDEMLRNLDNLCTTFMNCNLAVS